MANYSDFMVYVNSIQFDAARAGDEAAKKAIQERLEGVDIYFHACGAAVDGDVGVTIADVICAGIIKRVTLHADEYDADVRENVERFLNMNRRAP